MQFISLRNMHELASSAQLVAVILMTVLIAWVRYNLVQLPVTT
jgi:hypothetical protein